MVQQTFQAKIKALLHRIISFPAVYDFSQWLAGASISRKIILQEFASLPPTGRALDVGGGTGLSRPLLPERWTYCCLDADPQKLKGFRRKYPDDQAIEASACDIPYPDGNFDLCIMFAVSHHLTVEEFGAALAEAARVLRRDGVFILLDAVWEPANLRGRFLWSVDQGSYPKKASNLRFATAKHFAVEHEKSWRVHHEYLLLRGRPLRVSDGNT